MDPCMAAKQRPGPRVAMQQWEQEGLYLEDIWTVAREAEQTEGAGEKDGTDSVTYD